MKKFIVCGDVHWSLNSSILRKRGQVYSERLENLIESVNWVESLAKKNEVDGVIYLGDFFDRPDLGCEEITAIQEVVWNSSEHYFIIGNHESNIISLEFASTKLFETIGATVISDTTIIDINDKVDFTLIPYIKPENVRYFSEYVPKSNKKHVMFGHEDLSGIQYGAFSSQFGFNVEDIEKQCTLFINGHLHNGGNVGNNIVLAGNLTGQNFTEDAFKYEHGAYLLTVDDNGVISLEFYENPYAYNFCKMTLKEETDFKLFDRLKSRSVVHFICQNKFASKLEDYLEQYKEKICSYKITYAYDTIDAIEEDEEEFVTENYFDKFISFVRENIEKTQVLEDEIARLMS